MNQFTLFAIIILGAVAGYMSGLVGIGGGVIIVPALVLLFGYNQYLAQGTTLAMLVPPIGIMAVLKYHEKGFVDFKTALFLCIGFFIGGYLGSITAIGLSEVLLKRIFAFVLIGLGVKMFYSSI
jgi:uncharacterized membrane protein YfcA